MLSRQLLVAAASLGFAASQVTTSCQPLNQTCPPDPAFSTSHFWNFNSTPSSDLWENYGGIVDYDPNNGATFTIASEGDSPTIRTKFYFFFGRTELVLKAAPGQGIVSSMMWLSDDLDEVDWEFLGTNTTDGFSNYFGKGVQDYHNSGTHPVSNPQDDFHNYTVDWTKDYLNWYVDGNMVRTLLPQDANDTKSFPQTPMRMSLGIWAGGAPDEPEGVVAWAGGKTDYSKGPYNMYVKSAFVQDYSSGKEYKYGDRSGDWQSIKVIEGNSTAVKAITHESEAAEPLSEKWANLPTGAKIGIYAGGAAFAGLAIGALAFSCIRRRRLRSRAAQAVAQRNAADRVEMERLKEEGIDPDSLAYEGQEYRSRDMKKEGFVDSDSYSIPPTPNSPTPSTAPPVYAATAGAGGMAAMHAYNSRTASPAPSSMYHDIPTPGTPQPSGLGAPPPRGQSRQQGYGRIPPQSPYRDSSQSPRSPEQGGYGAPPPMAPQMRSQSPMMRSQSPAMPQPQGAYQSPMMRSQSPAMPPPQGALPPTPMNQMRSDSGPAAYGRRGSPGPQQGYGNPRMQSPGPIGPPHRNLTGGQPGYGRPPPRRDNWNQGGF